MLCSSHYRTPSFGKNSPCNARQTGRYSSFIATVTSSIRLLRVRPYHQCHRKDSPDHAHRLLHGASGSGWLWRCVASQPQYPVGQGGGAVTRPCNDFVPNSTLANSVTVVEELRLRY